MKKLHALIRNLYRKLNEKGTSLGEITAGMTATAVTGAMVVVAVSSGVTKIELKVQLANQAGIATQAVNIVVDANVSIGDGDEVFVSLADMANTLEVTDPSNQNDVYDTVQSGILLVNTTGNFKAYAQLKKKGADYCYISQLTVKQYTAKKLLESEVATPKIDDDGVTCVDVSTLAQFSDLTGSEGA